MDTWCTRSVALNFLGLVEDGPFAAQMPDGGFIHGLDGQTKAIIEAWGLAGMSGSFDRFPIEIPLLSTTSSCTTTEWITSGPTPSPTWAMTIYAGP